MWRPWCAADGGLGVKWQAMGSRKFSVRSFQWVFPSEKLNVSKCLGAARRRGFEGLGGGCDVLNLGPLLQQEGSGAQKLASKGFGPSTVSGGGGLWVRVLCGGAMLLHWL